LAHVRAEVRVDDEDGAGLAELGLANVDHVPLEVEVLREEVPAHLNHAPLAFEQFGSPDLLDAHPAKVQAFNDATITKRLRRMNNVPCLTLSKSRLRTLQLMRLCGTHSQVTLSMMTSLLHRHGATISSLWYSIVHLLLFCTASLRAATVVIHRLGTIDGAVVIGGVIVRKPDVVGFPNDAVLLDLINTVLRRAAASTDASRKKK
jgi:hypothetical protein